jgi:hypothetical protein
MDSPRQFGLNCFRIKKGDIQCHCCFQNKQNRGEWVFLLQDVSINDVYEINGNENGKKISSLISLLLCPVIFFVLYNFQSWGGGGGV